MSLAVRAVLHVDVHVLNLELVDPRGGALHLVLNQVSPEDLFNEHLEGFLQEEKALPSFLSECRKK